MSGDAVLALEGLSQRVRRLSDSAVRLATIRDRLVDDRERKKQEVRELSDKIEKLSKVSELYRVLMDSLVVKQVRSVESVVTEGLRTIFYDLDLQFEADVGQRYGKIAIDFFLRQGDKDDPLSHRGRPLDSFGGGPSSVASLILRMLTVLRLKLCPMLILDESLVAVSDEYIDNTGRFLQELAYRMGVSVLLVTHKQAFLDHADRVYSCSEVLGSDGTTRHLSLRSMKSR